MEYHVVLLFSVVFVLVFLGLRYLNFIADLALLYITIYVTDFILRWIKDPFQVRPLLTNLREKTVLITGCDSGFGHEMARRLDSIGVTVFAGCLFPEGPGAQELQSVCSRNLHIIPMDVTDDNQVNNAVESVKEKLGDKQLWSVVNNAGVTTSGDFEIVSWKNIQHVMNVNALGPARVSKAFLPMIRKSRGRIVIVASMAGRATGPELVPYCMSKHAAVSLADGLRRELMKFGVTVHTIEPWTYSTNISSAENGQNNLKKNWKEAIPEVRSAYGGDAYLETKLKDMEREQSNFRPVSKIHEVIDAMIHAALGVHPEIRYEVGTCWSVKPLLYLPDRFGDYAVYKPLPSNGSTSTKMLNSEE